MKHSSNPLSPAAHWVSRLALSAVDAILRCPAALRASAISSSASVARKWWVWFGMSVPALASVPEGCMPRNYPAINY